MPAWISLRPSPCNGSLPWVVQRHRFGVIDVVVEQISRQAHLRLARVHAEILDPLEQRQQHPRQGVGGAIEEGVVPEQEFGGARARRLLLPVQKGAQLLPLIGAELGMGCPVSTT